MIECVETEIRDALPDLVHGRLSKLDRATLGAHVESCASCRAEVELLKEIRASAPFPPRIDVGAIVAALPKPMPSSAGLLIVQKSAIQPSRARHVLNWAVAAALLAAGSLTYATARRDSAAKPTAAALPVPTAPTAPTAPTVSSVKSPEVASVTSPVVEGPIRSATEKAVAPAPRVVALSLAASVQDLTDDQLQALLNDLDNVEGLPSIEPEAVSIPVDDEGIR